MNKLALITLVTSSWLVPGLAFAEPPAHDVPAEPGGVSAAEPGAAAHGPLPGAPGIQDALRRLERAEPGLEEVRARAVEHAGLSGAIERAWAGRARLSALLPQVTVQASHAAGEGREVSRSSTGTERLDVGADRDFDIQARAVWNLDRLVFDDVEIRAAQAVQRTYRERVQLLGQVTSLYYQRRKLVLGGLLAPPADPYKLALHDMAVAEVTAQLDALTGGYFSRALHAH